MNKYIILKEDKEILFSQVKNDCETGFCFPVSKNDNLSDVIKKLCKYVSKLKVEETDPFFKNSPSYNITLENITNWDNSYLWGDHHNLYALINHSHDLSQIEQSGALTGQIPVWNGSNWEAQTISGIGTESDPIYTASSWFSTTNNSSQWDDAYSWGNHTGLYYTLGSTVDDSNKFAGIPYGGPYSSGSITFLMGYNTINFQWEGIPQSELQSFLSLGNMAYESTSNYLTSSQISSSYYPLSGNPSSFLTSISGLNISTLNNDSGYITVSSLSGYANLSGNNIYSGTNTFNNDIGGLKWTIYNTDGHFVFDNNFINSDGFGNISATSFTGLGTGLTGTASSLSIGGNAATVTNGVYTSSSYTNPSWITSLAWSKITGAPSFLTSITSSDVTTALGYTPYNSSNPNNYITSSAVAAAYQPLDSDLTSIAALSTTSFGRNLLTESSASSLQTTLSLVIGTNVQAWDADLDAISTLGFTGAAFLKKTGLNTWTLDTNTYLTTISGLNISLLTNDTGYLTSSTAISTYTPLTRTLTINGTTLDLSLNRSWTVGDVLTSGSYANPSWITSLVWSKIISTPTTLSGYGITDAITALTAASTYFPLLGGTITGTAGSGFIGLPLQSSNPSTPLSGLRLYADSSSRFSWIGTNGFVRTFDGTSNTASRVYTLPDTSGTVVLGTGTLNQIAYFSAGNVISSLNTSTYPSLTELSYVKGVTSSLQLQLDNAKENHLIKVAQAMGSNIKAQSLGIGYHNIVTANTIGTSGASRVTLISVYLETSQTITGVKWYQATIGSYTANNENRVGLYTVSGGTLTLVASSTTDGNLYQTGSSNTYVSKAFSSTYNASPGLYYIGLLFSNSSAATVPTIGCSTNLVNAAVQTGDFTNSLGMQLIRTTVTSLPSSITASSYNQAQQYYWASLY